MKSKVLNEGKAEYGYWIRVVIMLATTFFFFTLITRSQMTSKTENKTPVGDTHRCFEVRPV